ncbi:hypothetical protein DEM27_27870 [Metarhizobium album]|uniref:MlaB-like STAS domain-containing protein n=1 Tax=Metarhizobium album TaxID=2182425 RepID=A0A2U2DI08_9HYPH|nr:STAS domain-containing protein [Rhizobium album]PWE52914.1 hypothetical protein DEM27_27870 [Rhizobium album]
MKNSPESHEKAGEQPLSLPAPYTIRNVQQHYEAIREAILDHGGVRLDLAADTEPDLSFLQLLEIAREYAASQGKPFALENPASPLVRDKLEVAGFLKNADGAFHRFWFHQEAC